MACALPSRYDHSYYGPRGYYGPGYYGPGVYFGPGPVGLAAGVIGTAGAIAGAPFVDSYAYYDGPGYW